MHAWFVYDHKQYGNIQNDSTQAIKNLKDITVVNIYNLHIIIYANVSL